jgi:hypothetical protein
VSCFLQLFLSNISPFLQLFLINSILYIEQFSSPNSFTNRSLNSIVSGKVMTGITT